jgi:hypothetical protein
MNGRLLTMGILVSALAIPASGQEPAPPGGGGCISVNETLGGLYEVWFQELFSDPAFASARTADSLVTLSPSEPSAVWLASSSDCRNLRQDAVDAINAEYGLSKRWQDTEYVTVAIGPYILFVDMSAQSEIRPVVVFMASDLSLHTLIVSS